MIGDGTELMSSRCRIRCRQYDPGSRGKGLTKRRDGPGGRMHPCGPSRLRSLALLNRRSGVARRRDCFDEAQPSRFMDPRLTLTPTLTPRVYKPYSMDISRQSSVCRRKPEVLYAQEVTSESDCSKMADRAPPSWTIFVVCVLIVVCVVCCLC